MAKGSPKKEDAGPTAEGKPKASRKKLLIVVVATVVLLLGGGGAFLLLAKNGGDGQDQARAHTPKAPVFINLEPFTVDLQPENGEQYLQVVVTLKASDKSIEDNPKLYMPELRHKILLLLSGKKASEISTPRAASNSPTRFASRRMPSFTPPRASSRDRGRGTTDRESLRQGRARWPPRIGQRSSARGVVDILHRAVAQWLRISFPRKRSMCS